MAEFWLGVSSGVISSILVILIVGALRAPKLRLDVTSETAVDGDYPHGQFRFVHVRVTNPEFKVWSWQMRRPATFCRGELSFGDLGTTAARFQIDGRWSSLPEPVHQFPSGATLDVAAVLSRPREFLNPGDEPLLCLAIKKTGETACFAFNNRSYLHQPNWSNPAWSLGPGTYWVRVRVVAAEVEVVRVFAGSGNSDPSHSGKYGRSQAVTSGSSQARRATTRRPGKGEG